MLKPLLTHVRIYIRPWTFGVLHNCHKTQSLRGRSLSLHFNCDFPLLRRWWIIEITIKDSGVLRVLKFMILVCYLRSGCYNVELMVFPKTFCCSISTEHFIWWTMENIRTKLDILSKIFVGVFVQSVNIVVVRCVNLYETKFESLYNDEVNFLANKGCSYHSNYTM